MKKLITKSIFAFLAGCIFSLLLLSFINYEGLSNKPEILFDYPFLGFLIIIILALLFYDYILKLFNKGEIIIKWGSYEISLKELPEKIEQEISEQLENQEETKKANETSFNVRESASDLDKNNIIDLIKEEFGIKDNTVANLVYQLGSSEFKWRKLFTLSKRIGLEPDKIDELVKERPELIVRGIGKNGVIYKLNDNIKTIFNKKIIRN